MKKGATFFVREAEAEDLVADAFFGIDRCKYPKNMRQAKQEYGEDETVRRYKVTVIVERAFGHDLK